MKPEPRTALLVDRDFPDIRLTQRGSVIHIDQDVGNIVVSLETARAIAVFVNQSEQAQ